MTNRSLLSQTLYSLRIALVAMLIGFVTFGFTAKAAAAGYTGPEITFFYPSKMEEPVELKPNTDAIVYFDNGKLVSLVKAQIKQNDKALGTCVFKPNTNQPGRILMMKPGDADNADMAKLQPGLFTFEFFEITYVNDGEEITYSDIDNPFEDVTYFRAKPDYKLVSTTGLENNVVKSYYEAEGEEGLRTYTFNCTLVPDKIKVFFDYGQGNTYCMTYLPWSLNEEGNTITVDLRGHCYNVAALAPGVVFRDDNGNPCDPPTIISLSIEGLTSTDGTRISTTYKSLDGSFSYNITGRLYENFYYEDITFDTPVLTKAEYYNSEKPGTRYNSITAETNMMELYVDYMSNIAAADIRVTTDTERETIEFDDITVRPGSYVAALPQSIIEAGSENLTIGLVNVTYKTNDGAEHVIAPLGSAVIEDDITTIAALKEQPAGKEVELNIADGIVVTMSNDAGYTFAEDQTGGIQIVTADYSRVLNEGTLVEGRLSGTYMGNGMFMIDAKRSSYTESDINVALGTKIDDLSQLTSDKHNNCLITIEATTGLEIKYYEDAGYIYIGAVLPVITELVEGLVIPSEITNVTGIYYVDPSTDIPMLIVRSMADFNQDLHPVLAAANIAEAKALGTDNDIIITLTDAKVTYSSEMAGIVIIEDESGAMMMYDDNDSVIAYQGQVLNGTIRGMYCGDHTFEVLSEYNDFTETEGDVTLGAEMTVAEAADQANSYRLVTFNATEEMPIISEPSGLSINDEVFGVDYFGELWDVDFPADVISFTGIILPPLNLMDDNDDEDGNIVLVALRSINDIVVKTDAITSVNAEKAEADVYDLRGVKVRNAGEDTKSLKGIYIIGGKKVLQR